MSKHTEAANFSEFMNHIARCWSFATADVGVPKCIGQSIIVNAADRFKHGCGSKTYT